jgi:hypothetical protein
MAMRIIGVASMRPDIGDAVALIDDPALAVGRLAISDVAVAALLEPAIWDQAVDDAVMNLVGAVRRAGAGDRRGKGGRREAGGHG